MGLFNIFQKDPLFELEQEIKGLGNPSYPFLHPTYNPLSCIPCSDFSFWIKDRLKKKDYKSIDGLFLRMNESDPAILSAFADNVIPNQWTAKLQKIYNADLHRIATYGNEDAYLDLRTLLILDLPHSSRDKLTYFAFCMAPHIPKEIPYKNSNVMASVGKALSEVPLNSRAHFFDICRLYEAKSFRPMPLEKSSFYTTRQHGIYLQDSLKKICSLGLVLVDDSPEKAMNQYTKGELVAFGESRGISPSRSWKKEEIISFILGEDPVVAKILSEKYQLIYPSQISMVYYEQFSALVPAMQRIYARVLPYVV